MTFISNVERVIYSLDEAEIYYLAIVEGDKPSVRPFGTTIVYNDGLYIQTEK